MRLCGLSGITPIVLLRMAATQTPTKPTLAMRMCPMPKRDGHVAIPMEVHGAMEFGGGPGAVYDVAELCKIYDRLYGMEPNDRDEHGTLGPRVQLGPDYCVEKFRFPKTIKFSVNMRRMMMLIPLNGPRKGFYWIHDLWVLWRMLAARKRRGIYRFNETGLFSPTGAAYNHLAKVHDVETCVAIDPIEGMAGTGQPIIHYTASLEYHRGLHHGPLNP